MPPVEIIDLTTSDEQRGRAVRYEIIQGNTGTCSLILCERLKLFVFCFFAHSFLLSYHVNFLLKALTLFNLKVISMFNFHVEPIEIVFIFTPN